MTVVAILFVPLVLAYQGVFFHVFRPRVKAPSAPVPESAPPPT
jgi:cytochrome bd-type quinol oxidase subunit 2